MLVVVVVGKLWRKILLARGPREENPRTSLTGHLASSRHKVPCRDRWFLDFFLKETLWGEGGCLLNELFEWFLSTCFLIGFDWL